MSTHRRRQIDRDTAERLLRGAAAGHDMDNDPVEGLLAAVALPTNTVSAEHVLPGEEEAVTAFREARLSRASAPPKKPVAKVALASLLTWKAFAAAGITASAIGGAAIVGGAEPWSSPAPPSDAPSATGFPGKSPTRAHSTTKPAESRTSGSPATDAFVPLPGARPTSAPGPTSKPDLPSAAASRAATSAASPSSPSPSPSLEGLCRAYRAQGGGVLQNPAFDKLVEAAGRTDKVAAYCVGVLGPDTSGREPKKATSTPTSEPTSTGGLPTDPASESSTQSSENRAPARGNAPNQSTP
jgi:hypothetical protein